MKKLGFQINMHNGDIFDIMDKTTVDSSISKDEISEINTIFLMEKWAGDGTFYRKVGEISSCTKHTFTPHILSELIRNIDRIYDNFINEPEYKKNKLPSCDAIHVFSEFIENRIFGNEFDNSILTYYTLENNKLSKNSISRVELEEINLHNKTKLEITDITKIDDDFLEPLPVLTFKYNDTILDSPFNTKQDIKDYNLTEKQINLLSKNSTKQAIIDDVFNTYAEYEISMKKEIDKQRASISMANNAVLIKGGSTENYISIAELLNKIVIPRIESMKKAIDFEDEMIVELNGNVQKLDDDELIEEYKQRINNKEYFENSFSSLKLLNSTLTMSVFILRNAKAPEELREFAKEKINDSLNKLSNATVYLDNPYIMFIPNEEGKDIAYEIKENLKKTIPKLKKIEKDYTID